MPKTIPNCGSYTVELDVGTTTNIFIVGDAVAGVVGGLYAVQGSPDYRDVTQFVRNCDWLRGRRNRFQEQSGTPGVARIELNNNGYQFSIVNTASPYWNATTNRLGFEVGTGVRISREGAQLFTGSITNLKQLAERPFDSTVTISASDDLFKANNTKIPAITYVAQRSDERIVALVDSVAKFPTSLRALGAGIANLGLAPIPVGTSLKEALLIVNNSEQGRVFISRSGVLTFQKRIGRELRAPIATLTDTSKDGYQTFEIMNN